MVKKTKKIDEIILHVGLHKTGTTSIQQTLFSDENNKLLEKQNYLYPKYWPSNHSIPVYSIFCNHPEKYHINIKNKYSNSKIKDINERYLERLETEIVEREQSKLIISGEDISNLTFDNLNRLKEYFTSVFVYKDKIRVIIYIRNPLLWSISAIQEKIKAGMHYESTLKEMENIVRKFPGNLVEKYIQVFGREAIEIYTFEEAVAHEFGPVGHFLSILGFTRGEIEKFSMVKSNKSISLVAGDILSFINEKMPMIKDGKLNLKRFNGDSVPIFDIRGPKFDIPYSDKKKLLEAGQHAINWVKENLGIDYLVEVQQINPLNYEFTEETIDDIKKAYFQLSITLRGLLIEYLQKQLRNSLNNNSKLLLEKLINNLIAYNHDDIKAK